MHKPSNSVEQDATRCSYSPFHYSRPAATRTGSAAAKQEHTSFATDSNRYCASSDTRTTPELKTHKSTSSRTVSVTLWHLELRDVTVRFGSQLVMHRSSVAKAIHHRDISTIQNFCDQADENQAIHSPAIIGSMRSATADIKGSCRVVREHKKQHQLAEHVWCFSV